MPDVSQVSQLPLKIIFAVHFCLVIWGIQGWYNISMVLYNTLFFISLFWAVHSTESDEPIQFALFINVASMFFDLIGLAVYSPTGFSYARFGASLILINMILRGVTSLYLLRIGQSRGGSLNTVFSQSSIGGRGRQDYEDISHPIPQNSDFVGI